MSEEEVIKEIKDMIIAFDVQGYIREKSFIKEELKASNVLQEMLDLYNKQKEEIDTLKYDIEGLNKYIDILKYEIKKKEAYIEELENYMKEHPAVIPMPKEIREEAEKLGHFADLVTIEEKEYISKDKIRDKIKELEEYQKQHKEGNWTDIPIEDYDFDKINLLKELLEE